MSPLADMGWSSAKKIYESLGTPFNTKMDPQSSDQADGTRGAQAISRLPSESHGACSNGTTPHSRSLPVALPRVRRFVAWTKQRNSRRCRLGQTLIVPVHRTQITSRLLCFLFLLFDPVNQFGNFSLVFFFLDYHPSPLPVTQQGRPGFHLCRHFRTTTAFV